MASRQSGIEIVENNTGEMKIILPIPPPDFLATAISIVLLTGWIAGLVFILYQVFFLRILSQGTGFIVLSGLIPWTIGSLSVLWTLAGKEIISVSCYRMHLCYEVFGIRFTRHFERRDISPLELSFYLESPWWDWWGLHAHSIQQRLRTPFDNTGPIAFKYRSKTYQFGEGIEEDEAKKVIAYVNAQLER